MMEVMDITDALDMINIHFAIYTTYFYELLLFKYHGNQSINFIAEMIVKRNELI